LSVAYNRKRKYFRIQKPWITWITIKANLYCQLERATYIRRQSPLADNICLILLLKHFRPVEIRFFVVLFRRILVNDTRKKRKGLEIIVKFFSLTQTRHFWPNDEKVSLKHCYAIFIKNSVWVIKVKAYLPLTTVNYPFCFALLI